MNSLSSRAHSQNPAPRRGTRPAGQHTRFAGARKNPAPEGLAVAGQDGAGRREQKVFSPSGGGVARLSCATRRKPTQAPAPLLPACPKPSGGKLPAAGRGEGVNLRPHFPSGHPRTRSSASHSHLPPKPQTKNHPQTTSSRLPPPEPPALHSEPQVARPRQPPHSSLPRLPDGAPRAAAQLLGGA